MAVNEKITQFSEPLDLSYYLVYLQTIWTKYHRAILIVNAVGVILVLAYVNSLVPTYTATVTLHIAPKDNTMFNLEQLYWGDSDTSFKETQIGILQSKKLLRTVVENVELHRVPALSASSIRVGPVGFIKHLFRDKEQSVSEENMADLIESKANELAGLITVSLADEYGYSNLLHVSVAMAQAKLAADTANNLADSYIHAVYMNEMETALKNQGFLSDRLTVLREELQVAELRLRDYMEEQDIVSTPSGRSEVADQLTAVTNRFYLAQQERIRLENLTQQVKKFQMGGQELSNVSAFSSDPNVSKISSEVIDLERSRNELRKRYGKHHNKMIAIESELENARRSLQRQIGNVMKNIESDLAVAKRTKKVASQSLEEVRGRTQSRGRKEFDLTQLQQDIDVKRAVYTVFLEKLNQDDAAGPVRNTNLWVADPAVAPRSGSKLSWVTAVLAALVVCSTISIGVGGMLIFIDNSLETEADVMEKTHTQLLGMLPIIRGVGTDVPNTPFGEYLENLHSRFSEAIRTVRTSITLLNVSQPINKILVTSCQTHEGKTSVALCLAASFAQTSKVLLIDADLRRPSVENAVSQTTHKMLGLSDVVSGGAAIEDCITHHEQAKFDYLPAGSRSLNPLELIGSTQFTTLLNDLSDEYDYVIVDSPPCTAVSDAYLLGSLMDTVIFVVKASSTSVANIRSVLSRFHDLDVQVAGILLNLVNFESKKHPYYYQDATYAPYVSDDNTPVKLNDNV